LPVDESAGQPGEMPGDVYHAQGASHLGVVMEEAGYFQWDGKHHGIAWRLIDHDLGSETLAARLQAACRASRL